MNQFKFQRIHVSCAVAPAKPITDGSSFREGTVMTRYFRAVSPTGRHALCRVETLRRFGLNTEASMSDDINSMGDFSDVLVSAHGAGCDWRLTPQHRLDRCRLPGDVDTSD